MAVPGFSPVSSPVVTVRSMRPQHRTGSILMPLFLGATGTFGFALAIASIAALATGMFSASAVVTLTIGIILVVCSIYYAWRLRDEAAHQYELEVFEDGIRLRVTKPDGRHLQASMPFSHIDFVEYYTPRDRQSLVFHSVDKRIIEVPLWAMQGSVGRVFEMLAKKHINLVTL